MMATFIPKAAAASSSASNSASYSAQQRSTAAKLNGSLQQQLANGSDDHLRVVTPAKNGNRPDYSSSVGSNVTLQQTASPRNTVTQNLYDDKYLSSDKDLTNGMYSHELVSAISQITNRRDENSASTKSVTSGGGKLRVDPWGGKVVVEESAMKEERYGRVSSGSGNATRYATATGISVAHQDLNLMSTNDGSSDDMSSASEDVADVIALTTSDVGKPLSFARIASLNLEKQQVRFYCIPKTK